MLYNVLKRAIERGNYNTKEEMAYKLSVLYSAPFPQLTETQYLELLDLLQAQEN